MSGVSNAASSSPITFVIPEDKASNSKGEGKRTNKQHKPHNKSQASKKDDEKKSKTSTNEVSKNTKIDSKNKIDIDLTNELLKDVSVDDVNKIFSPLLLNSSASDGFLPNNFSEVLKQIYSNPKVVSDVFKELLGAKNVEGQGLGDHPKISEEEIDIVAQNLSNIYNHSQSIDQVAFCNALANIASLVSTQMSGLFENLQILFNKLTEISKSMNENASNSAKAAAKNTEDLQLITAMEAVKAMFQQIDDYENSAIATKNTIENNKPSDWQKFLIFGGAFLVGTFSVISPISIATTSALSFITGMAMGTVQVVSMVAGEIYQMKTDDAAIDSLDEMVKKCEGAKAELENLLHSDDTAGVTPNVVVSMMVKISEAFSEACTHFSKVQEDVRANSDQVTSAITLISAVTSVFGFWAKGEWYLRGLNFLFNGLTPASDFLNKIFPDCGLIEFVSKINIPGGVNWLVDKIPGDHSTISAILGQSVQAFASLLVFHKLSESNVDKNKVFTIMGVGNQATTLLDGANSGFALAEEAAKVNGSVLDNAEQQLKLSQDNRDQVKSAIVQAESQEFTQQNNALVNSTNTLMKTANKVQAAAGELMKKFLDQLVSEQEFAVEVSQSISAR